MLLGTGVGLAASTRDGLWEKSNHGREPVELGRRGTWQTEEIQKLAQVSEQRKRLGLGGSRQEGD